MAGCDMCGKERELVDAIVEGAVVQVCLDCSKHGSVVAINQPVVDKKIEFQKELESKPEYVDVIVEDFYKKIKGARERKSLNQEDLAQALAEKESVIHQLETGKLKPSFRLAKKLAVFLNIDLIESVESNKNIKKDVNLKSESVTIGDLLKK
ncbi:TIGR00270 family protein [Candidatus Woesearchaeota archaeon]|jgi:uncharacterized protein (TIGR00270 family)|nr:TIGR00270 family protein [Candidatus Woesearchaeota archaeon]MBT7237894.1 TIGR00270 family protein [Candidatus Woesearchaeota archaeon]